MKLANVEDLYELSPLQQGMLFHSLYDPQAGLYVDQVTFAIRGGLQRNSLTRAWQQAIDRHSVLRTSFWWDDDKPLQVVHRQVTLPFEGADWRHLDRDAHERRLAEHLAADRRRGFSLGDAPLLRVFVARVGERDDRVVLTFHHMLLDGWSLQLLLREVSSCYEADLVGRTSELAAPRPYREYITWLHAQDQSRAEDHWRRTFAGFAGATRPDILSPPSDAGAGQSDEYLRELPAALTADLTAFSRRHRVTLSTLLHGAWALLLSRYSATDDVVFGTVVAGRPPSLPGVESMIGLFINTVPLRVRIPEDEPVSVWLEHLQGRIVELRDYGYSALADVQRWSGASPQHPLFDTIFVFENYPVPAGATAGTAGSVHHYERNNFPLSCEIGAGPQLRTKLLFDSSRVHTDAVTRMSTHMEQALRSLIARPGRRLGDVDILTPQDRRRFAAWNATDTAVRLEGTVDQLVAAHAQRMPNNVAIELGDERLTYAELDDCANGLARRLVELGVRRGTIVGICLGRELATIVAQLAVLRAGGAFLALDSSYPRARITMMLDDAQPAMVITRSALSEGFADADIATLVLNDYADRASAASPGRHHGAGDLAYVIYTSGSTGRPKGVMIEHGGLINVVEAQRRLLRLTAEDRVLQFASCSFDASVFEMLMAFGVGATLCLGSAHELSPGGPLVDFLRNRSITATVLPPSALAVCSPAPLSALRVLTVAGEPCPAELVAAWAPGRRFLNLYGPTEATIWSTAQRCSDAQTPTIGRPIANTAAHILDRHGRRVPVGVRGELHLGGAGVGRGYLSRPQLTAERFVADTFGRRPGARLYRTGDVARYRLDGEIELLGRADDQVKLRGYRIELGEIEAVIAQHPAVRECAVVVRGDGARGPRIIAFAATAGEASAEALTGHVRERLPAFMVPARVVLLGALPRSASGKIDRPALVEAPAAREPAPDAEAWTEIERLLGDIWRDVLGLTSVSVRDNFFELGGHSLVVNQVVSRIEARLGISVPLRIVFEAPTIEELAPRVEDVLVDAIEALPEPSRDNVAAEQS